MGARRTGRERALQALYPIEMSQLPPAESLAAAWAAEPEDGKPDPEAERFARELVQGVTEHRDEVDRLIEQHSHNWRLDRMNRIDRNILRVAVFELRFRDDIPRKVTINEAVELGKRFGTEESSAFINGLLDRVAIALNKP
jgi:N utilization substance protein B